MSKETIEREPSVCGLYKSRRTGAFYHVITFVDALGFGPEHSDCFLALSAQTGDLVALTAKALETRFERVEPPTDKRVIGRYMRYVPAVELPAAVFMEMLEELRKREPQNAG